MGCVRPFLEGSFRTEYRTPAPSGIQFEVGRPKSSEPGEIGLARLTGPEGHAIISRRIVTRNGRHRHPGCSVASASGQSLVKRKSLNLKVRGPSNLARSFGFFRKQVGKTVLFYYFYFYVFFFVVVVVTKEIKRKIKGGFGGIDLLERPGLGTSKT